MPVYKFKETVEEIAEKKEFKLYNSHEDLIREIVGELEAKTMDASEAVAKLRENKDFKNNFSSDDFDTIEYETK